MAHLNAEWQARLVAFAWLLAAVAISHIAHYVLHALFRRLSLRRHSIVAEEIVTHTQQDLAIDVSFDRGFHGPSKIRCS